MRRRMMLRSSLALALAMAALWMPSGASATVALPFNCRTDSTAWRWTGTRWTAVTLEQATAIYVWPYATNWSWVWTQRTGWLALQDQYVVINPTYVCNVTYPLVQGAR